MMGEQVKLTITFNATDCSATREWVNTTIMSDVIDCLEHADINNQHDNLASTFSSIFIDTKKNNSTNCNISK